jgi:murein L,D-transpeptidase YcbB/YkuD
MNSMPKSLSRRAFARWAVAGLGTTLLAGSALAGPADGFGQAEWAQRYDSDARLSVPRSTTPLLSQQTLESSEAAIQRYQQLVQAGGWPQVPTSGTLKLGTRSPAVVALRQRLQASGDLDQTAGDSPVFDSYVEAGVRRFQARHGVGDTGVVGRETFIALNIPADARLRQLELNITRLRSFAGSIGRRFVTANIPAALVETVENGQVMTRHQAGVGRFDRQSPIMQAKVIDINFNPYWTVPVSIIRKDLIPKMQSDPNYLSDNKIRIFNKENQEVQSSQVNWNSMEAVNYRFRQDQGGDLNSLGVVRINIANPYGVYMHDTPSKGIFGDDYRFVSSGCMRVQNVRDYVAWLLKETPGWDRDRIDQAISSGERLDAKLAEAVPVYWVYVTAWATPEGIVQFRDDIYQKDGLGVQSTLQMPEGDGHGGPSPASLKTKEAREKGQPANGGPAAGYPTQQAGYGTPAQGYGGQGGLQPMNDDD